MRKYITIFILALVPVLTNAEELKVATWNIKWFFDHDPSDNRSDLSQSMAAPSSDEWNWRAGKVAEVIAELQPTVIGLQEIEDRGAVADVAAQLARVHGLQYHVSFVQGRDNYTEQDVAFLVRDGITFQNSRFRFTDGGNPQFKDLSKHQRLDFEIDGESFTIVIVHLTTRSQPRERQCRTLRKWINSVPDDTNLIVLGDMNSGVFPDSVTAQTDLGIVKGLTTADPSDDLVDILGSLPRQWQKTFKRSRPLDRIMISPNLNDGAGYSYTRIFNHRDAVVRGMVRNGTDCSWNVPREERDLSDHFPIMATFETQGDPSPPVPEQLAGRAVPIAALARGANNRMQAEFVFGEGGSRAVRRINITRDQIPDVGHQVTAESVDGNWVVTAIRWELGNNSVQKLVVEARAAE